MTRLVIFFFFPFFQCTGNQSTLKNRLSSTVNIKYAINTANCTAVVVLKTFVQVVAVTTAAALAVTLIRSTSQIGSVRLEQYDLFWKTKLHQYRLSVTVCKRLADTNSTGHPTSTSRMQLKIAP